MQDYLWEEMKMSERYINTCIAPKPAQEEAKGMLLSAFLNKCLAQYVCLCSACNRSKRKLAQCRKNRGRETFSQREVPRPHLLRKRYINTRIAPKPVQEE